MAKTPPAVPTEVTVSELRPDAVRDVVPEVTDPPAVHPQDGSA